LGHHVDYESDVVCCAEGRSKLWFVRYINDTDAQKAVDAENGRDFEGEKLSINLLLFKFVKLMH